MIDLNKLSEYTLQRIKRLAAEDEKAQKNIEEFILGMQALIICRGENLKNAPETYTLIGDFISDWPKIKAKRRYDAALTKLKEMNCHE